MSATRWRCWREMRRVTRPGGLVAVRDADYAAMTWHPGLARARRVAGAVPRGRSSRPCGEPDAGRHLRSWALAAGFAPADLTCYCRCLVLDATQIERDWWSQELGPDRVTSSAFAQQALGTTASRTMSALEELAAGFRRWAASDDAWWAVLNGEILCRA